MWVAAAEADGTRRTMIFLISCLVGIAVLLTGLTIWYWFFTRPDDDRDDESEADPGVGDDPVAKEPAGPVLDLAEIPLEAEAPPLGAAIPANRQPQHSSVSRSSDAVAAQEDLDADGELVTETSDRGREFSDDGWDAIQQSVFKKFQR